MYRIRVTAEMARRMVEWLQREGIRVYDDAATCEDLIRVERKDRERRKREERVQ
jgi:hypothetical protein